MDKIKSLVTAGSTIPGAVKEVLSQKELSVAAFAKKYDRNGNNMNSVITGNRAPTDEDVAALIAELGGTPEEWIELLLDARRQTALRAS